MRYDARRDADTYADHHADRSPYAHGAFCRDPDPRTISDAHAASSHADRIAHAYATCWADTYLDANPDTDPGVYANKYAWAYAAAIADPDTWRAADTVDRASPDGLG